MTLETKFRSLLDHVQKVTFVQMIATISFAMMLVSIVILYEAKTASLQRYIVPGSQTAAVPLVDRLFLSPASIHRAEQFAADHPEITVVGVVSVSLTENNRSTLIRLFNDKELEKKVTTIDKTRKDTTTPLFTSDPVNNAEMSSLLNGEFLCSPASGGSFTSTYGLEGVIKTTCRVPVPPYYGKLTGYIVLHTKKELSIYEVDALRKDALRLAIEMYYADVTK